MCEWLRGAFLLVKLGAWGDIESVPYKIHSGPPDMGARVSAPPADEAQRLRLGVPEACGEAAMATATRSAASSQPSNRLVPP